MNKDALKDVAKKIAGKFNSLVRKGNYDDLEEVFEEIDDANAGRISVRQLCRVIEEDLKIKDDVISKKDLKRLVEEHIDQKEMVKLNIEILPSFVKLMERTVALPAGLVDKEIPIMRMRKMMKCIEN